LSAPDKIHRDFVSDAELARSGGSSSEAHLRCCRRINPFRDRLFFSLARPRCLFIVVSNLSVSDTTYQELVF
jgi:hypothetical protein